jgi:hypothetical protein
MVDRRVTDGRRIGQLLASEVRGREDGPLGPLSVVDIHDVEGSVEGEFAYGLDEAGERVADVSVHAERAHLEFRVRPDDAADAAREVGLRVRPKATEPPRTLVFVESGAEVKQACDVLGAVVGSE